MATIPSILHIMIFWPTMRAKMGARERRNRKLVSDVMGIVMSAFKLLYVVGAPMLVHDGGLTDLHHAVDGGREDGDHVGLPVLDGAHVAVGAVVCTGPGAC